MTYKVFCYLVSFLLWSYFLTHYALATLISLCSSNIQEHPLLLQILLYLLFPFWNALSSQNILWLIPLPSQSYFKYYLLNENFPLLLLSYHCNLPHYPAPNNANPPYPALFFFFPQHLPLVNILDNIVIMLIFVVCLSLLHFKLFDDMDLVLFTGLSQMPRTVLGNQ